MAESKGSLIAKSMQKHAGRAKEKVSESVASHIGAFGARSVPDLTYKADPPAAARGGLFTFCGEQLAGRACYIYD